jgi:hypothetical protein
LPPRTLDELANIVDDAKRTVEQLKDDGAVETEEQLDDLYESLDEAADVVDALEEKKS